MKYAVAYAVMCVAEVFIIITIAILFDLRIYLTGTKTICL